MYSIGTWWMWLGFLAFVLLVIGIDIFCLGRGRTEKVTTRQALFWMLVWFMCAMVFGLLLLSVSSQKALEFFTGYIIEKSLSVDNMFVFLMVFNYFHVPANYQRRVLLYGVLSAIVLRFLMIIGGTWLVSEFHWVLYVFGVFLVFTGIKMLFSQEESKELGNNPLLKWLRRHLRVTESFHDEHFFVKLEAKWYVTPLFLALILIEMFDVIFALDSIPAIFSITNDVFIIATSNIFAILGLRALYFLLANMAERFSHLKYGVAFILAFVGAKMLLAPWIEIPILLALGIVILALALSMLKSEKRP